MYRLLGVATVGLLYTISTAMAQDPQAFTIEVEVRDSYLHTAVDGALVSIFRHGELIGTATTGPDGGGSITVPPVSHEPAAAARALGIGAVFPNPFTDVVRVEVASPLARDLAVAVYDLVGRRVVFETVSLSEGAQTLRLDLGHLPAGGYLVGIVAEEEHHARLVTKTGPATARPPSIVETDGPAALWEGEPAAAAQPEFRIRVEKERFQTYERLFDAAGDTTLTVDFDRLNEVIVTVVDQDEQVIEHELLITGPFVNLEITAPDTLLLRSGVYTAVAPAGWTTEIDETIEIPSVDSSFVFPVTQYDVWVTENTDLESEILFRVIHREGGVAWYFGYREDGALFVTHLHLVDADGEDSPMTVIYDQAYYPIQWTAPEFTLVARTPADADFDPDEALLVLKKSGTTMGYEVSLVPDAPSQILAWLVAETDLEYANIAGYLGEVADDMDAIRLLAMTPGDEQIMHIVAMTALMSITAEMRLDAHESWPFERAPIERFLDDRSTHMRLIKAGRYIHRIQTGYYDGLDIEGPTTTMYLCRGASWQPNRCQFTYFSAANSVSLCVNRCVTSLACFTEICHPMVMSVEDALTFRQNH